MWLFENNFISTIKSTNTLVVLPFSPPLSEQQKWEPREEEKYTWPFTTWRASKIEGGSCQQAAEWGGSLPSSKALLEKGRNKWTSSHLQFLLESAVLRGAEIQTAQASESTFRSPDLWLFFTFFWEIQVSSAPRETPFYLFCFLRRLFLKPGLLFLIFF